MSEQALPTTYKGYATKELLELFRDRPYHMPGGPDIPREKISIMWDLLAEYRILPWEDSNWSMEEIIAREPANIVRTKRLTAPFGVDIYPWADENGESNPDWQEEVPEGCIDWDLKYAVDGPLDNEEETDQGKPTS